MDEQLLADLPPLQEPPKDGGPLRRPMNAFLIFCKKHRTLVREKNPHLDNRSVTRILGELWATLPSPEKDSYLSLAKQYRDAFLKANPGYHWHSNKRENPAVFKPVQRNQSVTLNPASGSNSKVIEAGKLADPSNMGGLGLLLMAGSGVTPQQSEGNQEKQKHTASAMQPPTRQPGRSSGRTSVSFSGSKVAPVDGLDNGALLHLAEMCSSRLEAPDNSKPSREQQQALPHGAVNQQWLPGSYAMTPPWTPKYEGQASPKHELSPSESKDFPLDLSKQTSEQNRLVKKSSLVSGGLNCGEDPNLKSHQVEAKVTPKHVHQDRNLDRKCSNNVGCLGSEKSSNVPSGRMLVNQMIETVFHSDMLLEPKKKDFEVSTSPPKRKRSLSLSETRINEGSKCGDSIQNDNPGKAPAMTFGEIQEKLIRKAMEDSSAFIHSEQTQTKSTQQPLNLSHAGMDLAIRDAKNLNSFSGFNRKNLSSYPTSPQRTLSTHPFTPNVHVKNRYEATNIGFMRDAMLDSYKKVAMETRKVESVDLTCTEDLEGYDSEENRCSKVVSEDQPSRHLGGSTGQKLREQIETQLTSHLMASAGVLPPGFLSGNYTGIMSKCEKNFEANKDEKRKKNERECQTNQPSSRIRPQERSNWGSVGITRDLDGKIGGFQGNSGPNMENDSVEKSNVKKVYGSMPTESQKSNVEQDKKDVADGGGEITENQATNQERAEKKVRRRRRNVMEMTIDPYGENLHRGQASNGSESPEEKSGDMDLMEEDESGVRKSKRRNRGQKYQELLSQGLLQVGRQRKSDSLSESQEGATLDQAVVKRTRKSTSEMSLNVSKDEVFTDNTSFDLDAEIASLPALALEVTPVSSRQRGTGVRGGMRTRSRHTQQQGSTRSQALTTQDINTDSKMEEVKELSIAELGQLTKVCQDTMIQKSGSQKRKARKSAISHLVLVKPCVGGKEDNNNQNHENQPNDPCNRLTHNVNKDATSNHGNLLDFATLVNVAVAENEKLGNVKEITVSCT